MIGTIIIWIAFAAALGAACIYYLSIINKKLLTTARSSLYLSIACIITASVLLMLYILQHRFEYSYIANYSSRDLPFELLVTTFWAGQEGSLLLWALLAAVIGIIFRRYTKRIKIENEGMAVYSLILAFLLLLIAAKSPFRYLSGLPEGFVPADGNGLNPILQNFWMIIHPPVLFIGFASLAVPFVLAVVGLWRKKYKEWIKPALPWVLFGSVSLGAGIILGGYWAYGVLGWGGWWGWDPVENSSLVPWMITIILIHTMLIQKKTGRLLRINFMLAMLTYLLVIYSTFLTRSGVLASTSVHSFVDPGSFTYGLLFIWIAVFSIGGFGLLFLRHKKLKDNVYTGPLLAREFFLTVSTVVMGISAAVILFGTSLPLLSKITIEPSFYDKTNFPLSVLMVLFLGLSLSAKWKQQKAIPFIKNLIVPAVLSFIGMIGMVIAGLHDIPAVILVSVSVFSLIIAVLQGYKLVKDQPWSIGTVISHAGFAILFLGIVGSGRYGQNHPAALPLNETISVLGYNLTYGGIFPAPDGKDEFLVLVEYDGGKALLKTVMFEGPYGVVRSPDYISTWSGDFYIEPVSIETGKQVPHNVITLIKDETQVYDSMAVTFKGFDLRTESRKGMMSSSNSINAGAVIQIVKDKDIQEVVPTTKFMLKSGQIETEMKTAYTKEGKIGFQLVSLDVTSGSEKSSVQINIVDTQKTVENNSGNAETLIAEVSIKPFMNLIWIAAVLILAGLIVSLLRYFKSDAVQARG